MVTMGRVVAEEQDPLTLAAAPPKDETPAQRMVREKAEMEARRVSDEIDEQIRKEKQATKRRKRPVKVLLLGQSESGASRYTVCVIGYRYANQQLSLRQEW
jgi:guanine nucleotide-binding protein alpha-1 subunit